MSKELYIGSLSFETTEYDIEKLFSVSGTVTSVHLIHDNKTGEFKGCGYVRMSSEAEAKDAVASLDGAMLIDRRITVSEARPKKDKPQPGGYKGKSSAPPAAVGSGKAAPAKSAFSKKPAAAKPAAAKTAHAKPAASKPGTRSAASKPTGAKAGFAKTSGSQNGKPKTEKR